ncbi:LPXTG cell wall anchor domain-containing protein [Venturia nashicola]|nr:LPXTG cell wall anchor domain-containing protein [Venturia nashicola]
MAQRLTRLFGPAPTSERLPRSAYPALALNLEPQFFRALPSAADLHPGLQPSSKQPSSKQPSSKQPSSKQPSSKQPSSKQPSSKQPSSKQPSSKQPSSKQPSTKQTSRLKYTGILMNFALITIATQKTHNCSR